MKEKKEVKAAKAAGKVTVKTVDALSAYNLLSQQREPGKQGFRLSGLETEDIFRVLYAVMALKPVAAEYAEFEKDVRRQFEPEDWAERRSRYDGLPDEEKEAMKKEYVEIEAKVQECLAKEREKEREVEAYERLDREAFGKLIRSNDHIEDAAICMLLMEMLM